MQRVSLQMGVGAPLFLLADKSFLMSRLGSMGLAKILQPFDLALNT